MLPHQNFTTTSAYKNLLSDFDQIKLTSIQSLFKNDPNRADRFSVLFNDVYLDYSKNIIDQSIFDHLISLADECRLGEAIKAQFTGQMINQTEKRAVLHTALRSKEDQVTEVNGKNIIPEIWEVKIGRAHV